MLTGWWSGLEWQHYELDYGDVPGARQRLLEAATFSTRVVDLRPDLPELWRGVRQSYHAPINRLGRELEDRARWSDFGSVADIPQRWHEVVRAFGAGYCVRSLARLHAIEAGRVTRSDATWQRMGNWLETGHGLAVLAQDREASTLLDPWLPLIGYAYFVIDGPWSYYFSAVATRRDLNMALVWWGLRALKARGVRWLEIGWQDAATDEKGKNIEFFKRGFGGVDMNPQGEPLC